MLLVLGCRSDYCRRGARDVSQSTVAGTLRGRRRRPPARRARSPRTPRGAGPPSEPRRCKALITLNGRSGTAIASGRELLARGERDDARLKYFV